MQKDLSIWRVHGSQDPGQSMKVKEDKKGLRGSRIFQIVSGESKRTRRDQESPGGSKRVQAGPERFNQGGSNMFQVGRGGSRMVKEGPEGSRRFQISVQIQISA